MRGQPYATTQDGLRGGPTGVATGTGTGLASGVGAHKNVGLGCKKL